MLDDVLFFGDPHGRYDQVYRACERFRPREVVFVGDMDLDEPFERKLKPLMDAGIAVHWIHGNHDTDQQGFHDFLFNSALADRSISRRVVDIGGVRVAGLGGVFRQQVWHPRDGDGEPRHLTRESLINVDRQARWKGGVSLRHRSTIFPEDVEALADLQADVLVTHEAPTSHKYGFAEIDLLAEVMGVKAIVHGHHHEPYEGELTSGIRVFGLEKAGVLEGRLVLAPDAVPAP